MSCVRIFAFLIMYQHRGIDVYNSYTAEDILHNFREQELVGRNEYYYMFRRSDTGRGSLMHYISYMVGCFRRYDRIRSRGISFTYHHQEVVADRRRTTEVLEYFRFMSDQIMHNTLSEGKSNMQQHARSIIIPASDSCHTYCSWTMASHTAPAV